MVHHPTMKAYSLDLREKIVDGVLRRGMSKAQAARTFGVGATSVKRYVKLKEEGKPLSPGKAAGKKCKLGQSGMKLLEGGSSRPTDGQLRTKGRLPLQGARRAGEHLDHLPNDQTSWLHKKKRSVGASEGDESLRAAWRVMVAQKVDPTRLVFLRMRWAPTPP